MPRIRVEPAGYEITGPPGETVAALAERQGYYWPRGCDWLGQCTNCCMTVISGLGRLSRMGRSERENLVRQRGRTALDDPRTRLACQAGVEGDVIVYKRGVLPAEQVGGDGCHT